MAKTYNNLFEKICSFENLHLAYLKARKCKRYNNEILEFSYNLEKNLFKLQEGLLNQTYKHGGYREFIVCDSKKREIKAAPFSDRVIHHAVCNIIEPIFDKGFIYDSYACRNEKGTHRAIKKLESILKSMRDKNSSEIYCLQCDISKYFKSIDHNILLKIIKNKIKDEKTIWLIEEIIRSSYDRKIYNNLFDFRLTGIPIGNLTSQLFANIYLNELDQFIKHELRKKYYLRYMDDFLIFNYSKRELNDLKQIIKIFLNYKLELNLHPKKVNIFPVNDGVDFLGYLIFNNYRLLRKSTIKRFEKRTKKYQKKLNIGLIGQEKFDNSLQSWNSYAEFASSWKIKRNLEEKLRVIIHNIFEFCMI